MTPNRGHQQPLVILASVAWHHLPMPDDQTSAHSFESTPGPGSSPKHETSGTAESSGQKVSWFELFYDLVVVAAVALIGKVYIKSPDGQTTALVVTSLLVLFAIWILTTISHGLFPNDDPVRRVAVLVQMATLSVAALSLGKEGLANWIGYSAVSCTMLTVAWIFGRHSRSAGVTRYMVRLIIRLSLAAAAAFALSAVASIWLQPDQVAIVAPIILLVASAVVLVPVITVLARLIAKGQAFDQHYLQERFGLFVIIVLGESLIGLLAALAGKGSIPNPMFFALTFIVAFSIWSVYFNGVLPFGIPSSANRLRAWLGCHALLVLSIVVVAVEFADLTLNDAELAPTTSSQTWSVLPMTQVILAIVLLTFTLRTPWAVRGANLATLGILLVLMLIEGLMDSQDGNWFIALGAVVLAADALACSLIALRSRPAMTSQA